jgi:hypothetical protein
MTTASPAPVTSQREVARRLGISHTALQKAARAGRIAPEAEGGWDIEKVRSRLASSADPARHAAPPPTLPPTAAAPPVSALRPVPEAAEAVAVDTLRAHGLPAPRTGGTTFHDARTANEILKAQERRLRLDERKGRLVDKARSLMLVHRLAKEERDAILAWPARIAAEMAAELGVDAHRLQTMMDTRLRAHLAERNDVRVSVG